MDPFAFLRFFLEISLKFLPRLAPSERLRPRELRRLLNLERRAM